MSRIIQEPNPIPTSLAAWLLLWWAFKAGRQRQPSVNDRIIKQAMLHFVAAWFLIGAIATIIERTLSA